MASLNLPSVNINPGVIQGGGAPDPLTQFLAALAQGQEVGVAKMRERGLNSRSSAENELAKVRIGLEKERIGLERDKEATRMAEAEAKARQQETLGKLHLEAAKVLLPWMVSTGQGAQAQQQFFPQQGQQAPSQPAPAMPTQGAPSHPLESVMQVLQQAPPEVLGELMTRTSGMVNTAQSLYQKQLDARARTEALDRAVAGIKDPAKQNQARAALGLIDVDAAVATPIIKEIFPEGWTHQDLSNWPTVAQAFGIDFGQYRAIRGLPAVASIPDDTKYSRPSGGTGGERAQMARALLQVMGPASRVLDHYRMTVGSPGLITNFMKAAEAGTLKEALGNAIIDDADKQWLSAGGAFADGWIRFVSGAQTNEREYGRLIRVITDSWLDGPAVRQQKANMRRMMLEAVQTVAIGEITGVPKDPVAELDKMLKYEWDPRLKRFLEEERLATINNRLKRDSGVSGFNPNDTTPGGTSDATTALNGILFGGGRRTP